MYLEMKDVKVLHEYRRNKVTGLFADMYDHHNTQRRTNNYLDMISNKPTDPSFIVKLLPLDYEITFNQKQRCKDVAA